MDRNEWNIGEIEDQSDGEREKNTAKRPAETSDELPMRSARYRVVGKATAERGGGNRSYNEGCDNKKVGRVPEH